MHVRGQNLPGHCVQDLLKWSKQMQPQGQCLHPCKIILELPSQTAHHVEKMLQSLGACECAGPHDLNHLKCAGWWIPTHHMMCMSCGTLHLL